MTTVTVPEDVTADEVELSHAGEIACPYCHAGPGKPCVTTSGLTANGCHGVRWYAVHDLWPLEQREARMAHRLEDGGVIRRAPWFPRHEHQFVCSCGKRR